MVSTINEIGNFYPRDSDAPFLVRTSVLHANQVDKMILKVPQELLKHNSLSEIIVEWLLIYLPLLFILSHSSSISIICYDIIFIALTRRPIL